MKKVCSQCGKKKDESEYHKKYNKLCAEFKVCFRFRRTQYTAKLKDKVFEAYGSKCKCCGEKEREFLVLDHVNGDGSKHRNEVFGNNKGRYNPDKFYNWIIKNKFPKSLQILCANCNKSKGLGKLCVHQRKKLKS